MLLASQSNLAVDNALGRFANTPNIRPIRRYAQSAEVDPEAEKFLEGNVIKDFFIPSIRQHCEIEQAESEHLLAAKLAITKAQQALPLAIVEIENEANNLKSLETEKERLTLNLEEQNLNRGKHARQLSALNAIETHLNQNTLHGITEDLTNTGGLDYYQFAEHQRVDRIRAKEEVKEKIVRLLDEPPSSAPVSPTILRLEAEKNEALEEENYLRAQEIKLELEKERQEAPDSGTNWISWTRQLGRLNGRLQEPYPAIADLTQELSEPENFNELIKQIRNELDEFVDDLLETTVEELVDLVQRQIQEATSISNNQERGFTVLQESLEKNREATERSNRKHVDAVQHCRALLAALPTEVSGNVSPETGIDLKALNLRAEAWMLNNNSNIEADSIWRNIRRDWLEDLENPEASTLQDLETMYTQMVNVEGVTTSFAGKFAWYNQHLKAPFDIVIIDEISKATPPEILLPILLGKRPSWSATTGSCRRPSKTQHQGVEKKFKPTKSKTSGFHVVVNLNEW